MAAANPIVRFTSTALLEGLHVFARNCGTPVSAFLGVPYAEPPERFQPPKPVQFWTGTKMADQFGAICPQKIEEIQAQYFPFQIPNLTSEDCLYLNVWTPTLDSTSRLPIMVFFYGGGYTSGCSNYFNGTAYAAHHNVVFVSVNFRIGLLGFLSTGDDEIPGNMGLLDQREALNWVQRYIHLFGGDPDNVTIFGESAGAMNVCWHLLSPGSRDLFNRVILQSGTLCYNTSALTKLECSRNFGRVLGALGLSDVTSVKEAVKCLKEVPVSDLVNKGPHYLFRASIDGKELKDHPLEMFARGEFHKTDMLLGFNTNEGPMFMPDLMKDKSTSVSVEEAQELLKTIVFRRFFSNCLEGEKIYELLRSHYIDGLTDPKLLYQRLTEVYGDIQFVSPTIHLALLHSNLAAERKTFLYQFDHRFPFSRSPEWITALHAAELPYVIGEPFLSRLPDVWPEDDRRLSSTMIAMWSRFARAGDPNTGRTDSELCWTPYDSEQRCYAVLNSTPKLAQNYRRQLMDLHQIDIGRLTEVARQSHLDCNL